MNKIIPFREYYLEEVKRWGKEGAGVVIYCMETGNFLWSKRSKFVMEPRTWTLTIGGKVDEGENPFTAAKREFNEETGYEGKVRFIQNPRVDHFSESGFEYSTFLAISEKEFSLPSFSGQKGEGQWEIEKFFWGHLNKIPGAPHFSVTPRLISSLKEIIDVLFPSKK